MGERVGEDRVELFVVDSAEQCLCCAVGVDHNDGWLAGHGEPGKDVAPVVADVRERQGVLVDEALEGCVVTRPCDADEVDLAIPPLSGSFDRSCFSVADASSRRPEPEHDRPPSDRGTIEGTPADKRGGEGECLGNAGGRSRGGGGGSSTR